jgi:hypothetical protein
MARVKPPTKGRRRHAGYVSSTRVLKHHRNSLSLSAGSPPQTKTRLQKAAAKNQWVWNSKISERSSHWQIEDAIWEIHYNYGNHGDDWHMLPQPIGFVTGIQKTNWRNFPESKHLLCYSKFYKAGFKKSDYVIALFTTWTETWVRNKEWPTSDWHAWVGIIRRLPSGYDLTIWDPNFDCNSNQKEMLIGPQWRLIEDCKPNQRKLQAVWLGGSPTGNPDGKCLTMCLDKIKEICKGGTIGNFPTFDAMEAGGYSRLLVDRSGRRLSWEVARDPKPRGGSTSSKRSNETDELPRYLEESCTSLCKSTLAASSTLRQLEPTSSRSSLGQLPASSSQPGLVPSSSSKAVLRQSSLPPQSAQLPTTLHTHLRSSSIPPIPRPSQLASSYWTLPSTAD